MGGLAFLVLALAPPAHARETAKFKVLSISGATTADRAVVYEPTQYGDTCAFTQAERDTVIAPGTSTKVRLPGNVGFDHHSTRARPCALLVNA